MAVNLAGTGERRRHSRYEAAAVGCRLEWTTGAVEAPQARNLSASGICLHTTRALEAGEKISLKVSLPEPMGSALVRCIVRWIRPEPDSTGWLVGAEVIESTKAWLGPQDNCWNELIQ